MRLRATTRVRNDQLLVAREKMGLTQAAAAIFCGVPINAYARIERLDYRSGRDAVHAKAIATVFELSLEDVMPQELEGQALPPEFSQVREVDPSQVLEHSNMEALEAPVVEVLEDSERAAALERALGLLTYRQREVLRLRFGLGGEKFSLCEVAKIFKIVPERVRQIEHKALRKLGSGPIGAWLLNQLQGGSDD